MFLNQTDLLQQAFVKQKYQRENIYRKSILVIEDLGIAS